MKIFSSLRGVSALTLFVECITGTDDPDFAVTFDDLAEFASAFHRRSDFHFHFSFVSPGLPADVIYHPGAQAATACMLQNLVPETLLIPLRKVFVKFSLPGLFYGTGQLCFFSALLRMQGRKNARSHPSLPQNGGLWRRCTN